MMIMMKHCMQFPELLELFDMQNILEIHLQRWKILCSQRHICHGYYKSLEAGRQKSLYQGEWPSGLASSVGFTDVKHGCVQSEAG